MDTARLVERWWHVLAITLVVSMGAANGAGAALPDGRGYELVSPPAKGGGDVMAASGRTRVAVDGNAASFASLGGFGDVHGSGVAFDYISQRTATPGTSGWSTHPIDPQQPPSTLAGIFNGFDSFYDGDLAADLSCGVYLALRPLPGIGSPADVPNLYLRRDLLSPGPGTYELLMEPLVPVTPELAISTLAGVSDDCRHVIFESTLNLVPEATGTDRKLYEWADGTLRLAGILPDGTPAADSLAGLGAFARYAPGMVSPDGSRVFFKVPSDGNVYMRVDGTTTVQMNVSEKAVREIPQPASLWVVSGDGARAFFTTTEGLVDGDDDGGMSLYMFDADAAPGARLTLLSPDNEPGDGGFVDSVVGASEDGRYVYFFGVGQLVAGEPHISSLYGLYVWHDGEVRYIGRMTGATDVGTNALNAPLGFDPLTSRVSPDGRHLLFMLKSNDGFRGRGGFGGYDQGTTCTHDNQAGTACRELFVYSADTGSVACASCDPSGAIATGDALIDARDGTGAANKPVHLSHALSDDGSRVFFHTIDSLLPEDSNGRSDVYEYDVPSATVHLISSGKDPNDSYLMDASPNGEDVFFLTRERLVGWDIDGNYDLYDARVGGGLPDPTPVPPPCNGEACRGGITAAPGVFSPASSAVTGAGNATDRIDTRRTAKPRAKRCRGRAVRRRIHGKVRCVRRDRAAHKAGTNGRTGK